jgi:SAM-dependent methyltransferase
MIPNKLKFDEFKQFAESYDPFPWEISADHKSQPGDIKGKHSVLINLMRFWKILGAVYEATPTFHTIIDVGPFPGAMIKILRHYFPQEFEYWAVGLGLSESYAKAMEDFGGKCFATELDPEFIEAELCNEWPIREADCVLLLDVIEHLTNPIHCLDTINGALRLGGALILTTDNLTSFANVYQMARRGRSPNVHPVRSSMFYRGEWRPHFREFAAEELEFFLKYSGFSVTRHVYFERLQGDFFFDGEGHLRDRDRYDGIKGKIQKMILQSAPHLMDHQILIATKTSEVKEIAANRPKPTKSVAEWMATRATWGL